MNVQMISVSILMLMGLWGALGIYNATVFSDAPFLYAGKQLIWLFIGLITIWICSTIPFKIYKQYILHLTIACYISLLLVLFIGIKINGMKGWFDLGFGYLQPSELSKPIFILSLCLVAKIAKNHKQLLLYLGTLTLIWAIPIALQPDFGTLFIYLTGFLTVYILAGGKFTYLLPPFLAMLPVSYYIYIHKPYVTARITGFLDPEKNAMGSGWHILQFQYTMARGGFSGQSWGDSLWANSYLPLSYSDSAFASLVEAIGFIGTIPVIAGFCALAYAGYRLSMKTHNDIDKLFISSLSILITIQAFTHISVNVTMFPATGITLPMFSYGGSSLISTMASFGIILSAIRKK